MLLEPTQEVRSKKSSILELFMKTAANDETGATKTHVYIGSWWRHNKHLPKNIVFFVAHWPDSEHVSFCHCRLAVISRCQDLNTVAAFATRLKELVRVDPVVLDHVLKAAIVEQLDRLHIGHILRQGARHLGPDFGLEDWVLALKYTNKIATRRIVLFLFKSSTVTKNVWKSKKCRV